MAVGSGARAGRKRSEASRQAILKAALNQARKGGLGSVTMDGIACAAGVGKQTIYRWWKSKGAVVLEALRDSAAEQVEAPRTGSVRTQLRRFIETTFAAVARHRGTSQLLRGLMAEAQLDGSFRNEFRAQFLDERREALRGIFVRAEQAGQLREGFDVDLGVDLTFGVLWYRLLVGHGPLNDDLAKQVARTVCDGCLARRRGSIG